MIDYKNLLPCALCGDSAAIVVWAVGHFRNGFEMYNVECSNRLCLSSTPIFEDSREAIKRWNYRFTS